MSLKAGSPRYDSTKNKNVLDNTALIGSMALEIDNQMKKVYKSIKGIDMPNVGEEERRILFTAISRGVLKYLKDHANDILSAITITHVTGVPRVHNASSSTSLDIQVGTIP